MERINDRTVRVIIKKEDLEKRGIEFLDLLGNQKQVESFFRSILDEIDEDGPFIDSDSVSFQIMPTGDGLDLLISHHRTDDDTESDLERFLRAMRPTIEQDDQESKDYDEALTIQELEKTADEIEEQKHGDQFATNKYTVAVSNDIEALIAIAKELDLIPNHSELYHHQQAFFLTLNYEGYEITNAMFEDINYQIAEFANVSSVSTSWLDEYTKTLIEQDAVEQLRNYFK